MGYGIKFFSKTQLKQIITDDSFSEEVRKIAEVTLQTYELHLTLENLLVSQLPTKEQN